MLRFWLLLARTVLGCSLREAMQRITAREFRIWQAEYMLDPWGEERGDLQAAIVAHTTAECNRSKGPRTRIKDFMPDFDKEYRPAQTPEQMAAIIRAAFLMGGKKK